ncbi:MAG: hypothetical protein LBT86_04525 [Deltaproteobacteria bacterium]|nr:hypothetical protein [Deltaproteobacteria bacterium]
MRLYHRPEKAVFRPERLAIAHLADFISRAKGFGAAGDRWAPPISQAGWEALKLRKTDFPSRLESLEAKLASLCDLTSSH